jgi:hypothetical protein
MKRKFQRRNLPCLLLTMLLLGAFCAAQQQPEDYRVYAAVLSRIGSIPKADPHVVIYDRTLTGKCDGDGDNPVLDKGCTFLWVKPDTDQDVEHMLRHRFHGLQRSTWKSFKRRNASSIPLHDPLPTPWKHRFAGPDVPEDGSPAWQSPDLAIYLSRVGFNSKKTEAIVYVLIFSYIGEPATIGDYVRLRAAADGSWSLAGRVSYPDQDDTITASLAAARPRLILASQTGRARAKDAASARAARRLRTFAELR